MDAEYLDCCIVVPKTPIRDMTDDAFVELFDRIDSGPQPDVVRIDGFMPFMLATLYRLLIGVREPDDQHAILFFYDPNEPVHREGLDEEFPDEVLNNLGEDFSWDAWICWQIPEVLLQAVQEVPHAELDSLAARWGETRCVMWLRGSSDFNMQRPSLRNMLDVLREVEGPLPHGAWMLWNGEA
jgi:hypothetical protein